MKYRLKNQFSDIFFLLIYHVLALVASAAVLIYLTSQIPSFSFNIASVYPKAQKEKVAKKESESAVVSSGPVISRVKGEVLIGHKGLHRSATEGETLEKGITIEAKEKSTALLTFKGAYQWQLRITPGSIVNIDELMKKDSEDMSESYFFNLVKGAIYANLLNTNGTARMRVKTSLASFGVRGTKFAIISQENEFAILAVKNGLVQAESFKTFAKDDIEGGKAYVTNKDGQKKIEENPDIIDSFNWDLESESDKPIPTVDSILNVTGQFPPVDLTSDTVVPSFESVSFDKEFETFKKETSDLIVTIEELENEIGVKERSLKAERAKILDDIDCLKTSNVPCSLYSEKILTMRGFPRTFGPAQVRNSLVKDLETYLEEKNSELLKTREELILIKKLFAAREDAIKDIEMKKNQGISPEKLTSIMKDKAFIRLAR